MEDFVSFFLILICITIFYVYLENKAVDVTYMKSTIDNKEYLVRNLPDKQEAANILAQIREGLTKIVDHLYENKEKEKDKIKDIERLKKNYRPDNITESSPGNKYTSYSINKGEKLVFCIRAKGVTTPLEDINTLMFVAIHELAHLMTKEIGHPPIFWENMKYLLKKAIELGVYKKQNFEKKPVSYCGTKITNSPLD